jgi:hypothetical protein
MKKMDLEKVKAFIDAQSPETSVYLGCDSERVKVDGVWHAAYALAVVAQLDPSGSLIGGRVVSRCVHQMLLFKAFRWHHWPLA